MKPQARKALKYMRPSAVKYLVENCEYGWMIRVAKRSKLIPVAGIKKALKLQRLLVNHKRFGTRSEVAMMDKERREFVRNFLREFL